MISNNGGENIKVKVYYFSGTGNSLAVARDIAEEINGRLNSIVSLSNEEQIIVDADILGIVFPVYHQGLPLIIKKFIDEIGNLEQKYIFGICTYGTSPGICLNYLSNLIHSNGGRLAAGFAVKMPYNYIIPSLKIKNFFSSFKLKKLSPVKKKQMFLRWEEKLKDICEYIQKQQPGRLETKANFIENLVDFFTLREKLQKPIWLKVAGYKGNIDLPWPESIQLMDHGFKSEKRCDSCGGCAEVCPVNNIKLIDSRPVWQHHCEQCFACLQWCPKEAIQFRNGTKGNLRYQHPEVDLEDLMRRKK